MSADVVLAIVAGVLAGLLVVETWRRRRLKARTSAESLRLASDLQGLTTERDTETEAARAAARRAETAEKRVAELEASLTTARANLAEARARASTAEDARRAAEEGREAALAARDETRSEKDRLAGQVDALREHLAAIGSGEIIDSAALWSLELVRSERTWRQSVAATPDQASPFVGARDPLALAVEVEVAALREDVGVAIELEWTATVSEPARSLLVLRLAQELLAVAARSQQAVILSVENDGDTVVLHLRSPEGHDPLRVAVPSQADGLVSVELVDDGMRATIG